jgi:hypothetical protein
MNASDTSAAHGDSKEITIFVNGRKKSVEKNEEISFAEVIALAFDPVPTGPNISFTATYTKGHGSKPEGTLVDGGTVKVKDGMVFNVTATDKS